jgi:hypothetical protein
MKADSCLIPFSFGLFIGIGGTLLAGYSALLEQNEVIIKLEESAKVKPLITVEALGICKVKQGGKSYLLVDVTEEMPVFDSAETNTKK